MAGSPNEGSWFVYERFSDDELDFHQPRKSSFADTTTNSSVTSRNPVSVRNGTSLSHTDVTIDRPEGRVDRTSSVPMSLDSEWTSRVFYDAHTATIITEFPYMRSGRAKQKSIKRCTNFLVPNIINGYDKSTLLSPVTLVGRLFAGRGSPTLSLWAEDKS